MSVRIGRKDTASKLLCHSRWWRCYKLVLVLMMADLGGRAASYLQMGRVRVASLCLEFFNS